MFKSRLNNFNVINTVVVIVVVIIIPALHGGGTLI